MEFKLKDGRMVSIREIELEDAEAVVKYMEIVNKETKNLTREPEEFSMTIEQEENFIHRVVNSQNEFVYTAWCDGELISVCGIHGGSLKRLKHKVNLGISILMKYHNQGLGTKLMELLVDKAKELGKAKVELEVRADNPNAIKVYKRVGFEIEGTRKKGFYVDNEYIDLVQMGRIL